LKNNESRLIDIHLNLSFNDAVFNHDLGNDCKTKWNKDNTGTEVKLLMSLKQVLQLQGRGSKSQLAQGVIFRGTSTANFL